MSRASYKSVLVAYLFCVPLGILGLHKFYLRRPVTGVVYFFTGGLFLVGWLYDLVTLPEQVERCNERAALTSELRDMLEEEILDLEDEIQALQDEMDEMHTKEEVAQLKQRIASLEAQLRSHNEPQ